MVDSQSPPFEALNVRDRTYATREQSIVYTNRVVRGCGFAETRSRLRRKHKLARKLLAGTAALVLAGSTMALAGCGGDAYASPTHGPGHRDATGHSRHGRELVAEGKRIFRYDTFGDESFWTDKLKMNDVIQMEVSPKVALSVGLKVDVDALPASVKQGVRNGSVDLDDPATTLALLKLDAVVGLKGTVQDIDGKETLTRVGVTCALCHSTVDDSFAPGIGHRLDGWPNRDLDPGAIIALSPAIPDANKAVYNSWGPGKYDARFNLFVQSKGLAFFTDGQNPPHDRFAVEIPPAYGLAGIDKEIYTGDGDAEHEPIGALAYWNRYVAVTQMGGQGTFTDPRLVALGAAVPVDNTHAGALPDLVTPALPALQAYQLSIAAPRPTHGSFNPSAAARGKRVFHGQGQCATCHSGRQFTDANLRLHPKSASAAMDTDYVLLSATGKWRTSPLAGVWQHPPYFHDGSAATLGDVVNAYNTKLNLHLTVQQSSDLVQFLKSLPDRGKPRHAGPGDDH
jgi:mono/diheme cytochrome c family protein